MKFNRLGFVDTALKAAGSLLQPGMAPRPGAAPAGSAVTGGGPAPSATTVSPAMQQAFTPQFSPVMTMQQESPGAVVTATPTQTASPSQAARTGAPMPGGSRTPFVPGQPDYAPRERSPAFPEAFPDPFAEPSIHVAEGGMSDAMKMGLLAVAALGTMMVIGGDRKKGRNK